VRLFLCISNTLLAALTCCFQIFREQLLACDQDPEGIRYAKKFDLATRGLLATIKRFRMMKTIIMKKTRNEILKNKYVFAFKILGKGVFESVIDLMSLESLSNLDFTEVNGQKSGHQLLEEAVQKQMMEQSLQVEDIVAKQKKRAEFLAGIKHTAKEVEAIVEAQGPPVVKKPAFLRRIITSIKPRKEDIARENYQDAQPAAPSDAGDRPKVRMSLAQVQSMLQQQSLEARESADVNAQETGSNDSADENAAGVAALAIETGQRPRPPTGASQLMQAMGSVRARMRAGMAKSNPPTTTSEHI
jgi:hypothetical protein